MESFTFIADNGHIAFRWVNEHSGKAISTLLSGFVAICCPTLPRSTRCCTASSESSPSTVGAHVRRTFWRVLPTDKDLASEALSIISKLFEVERQCALIAMPERTRARIVAAHRLASRALIATAAPHRDGVSAGLRAPALPIHHCTKVGGLSIA
jgi:hypothetical protein